MRIKKTLLLLAAMLVAVVADAQDSLRHEVLFETTMGNVRVCLYNETPQHRDNFLKNVREGYYDGVLFHRVIEHFMVQTGDSASRHAVPGQFLGESSETYTVPAEIRFPQLFHKRGALAAAREADAVNPERNSSMGQFYIVWGSRYSDASLDKVQQQLDERTGGKVKLTEEVREAYKEVGGTPHLDGQYTVFGEVTEGLDVIERMQEVETDGNARPVTDIRIVKATVVR